MPPWILWREKTDGQRDSQGELGYNPATRPCVPKENGGGQTGKAGDIVAFLGVFESCALHTVGAHHHHPPVVTLIPHTVLELHCPNVLRMVPHTPSHGAPPPQCSF